MEHLRPIERRVVAMRDAGLPTEEIARRLRRSPAHVERVLAWTEIARSGPARRSSRALDQRVVALRAGGAGYDEIAGRFRRSPQFIRRVEGMAHYRRALDLLG